MKSIFITKYKIMDTLSIDNPLYIEYNFKKRKEDDFMKCPSCGAEIVSGKFCENCGSQISVAMLKEQEQLNKSCCSKCGSTNIEINREKQGEINKKSGTKVVRNTVAVCKDCGYTWYPNDATEKAPRKTWLWVLGWIFVFPVPLTILMVKNQKLKKWLKIAIIAAAWLIYLLIAFSGGASSEGTEEPTDINNEEITYTIVGEEIGQYGKIVTLNKDSDMPVDKYLYKLPAGKYKVLTEDTTAASVFIVKDEIGIEEGNTDYPETLQYVSEGYILMVGNDLNGHAASSYEISLNEDESIQIVGTSELLFTKIE